MHATADILGKTVVIESSESADRAMAVLSEPLIVEMELYFSCLIRKAVRFNRTNAIKFSVQVTPKLVLGFRPVATKACNISEIDSAPPLDDFPIVKPEAFVPRKLKIDFRNGQWWGEFQMA